MRERWQMNANANCMVRYKTEFDMKRQPKSTRDKVTMEEVNNALYKLLCVVRIIN